MLSSMLKTTGQLLSTALPAVLAIDLLYLYFAGSWYDPIKWIEITEVSLLIIISAVSLTTLIIKIRQGYRARDLRS